MSTVRSIFMLTAVASSFAEHRVKSAQKSQCVPASFHPSKTADLGHQAEKKVRMLYPHLHVLLKTIWHQRRCRMPTCMQ